MGQKAILIISVSAFLLSRNLLYALGINPNSESTLFVFRIPLALYGAVAISLLFFLSGRKAVPGRELASRGAGLAFFGALSLVTLAFWIAKIGSNILPFFVTFGTPAFIWLMLCYSNSKTREHIGKSISLLILINSVVAIIEYVSGERLLPFVVSDGVRENSWRATALLGHPLDNALITGTLLVAALFSRQRKMPSWVTIIHLAAMVAFAGRSAIIALCLFFAIYLLSGLLGFISGKKVVVSPRMMGAGMLLLSATLAAVSTGLANPFLARFTDDSGSAEIRWQGIELFLSINPTSLLFGLMPNELIYLQQAFNVPSLEFSWISIVINFGLIIGGIIIISTAVFLRSAFRNFGSSRWFVLSYFGLVTFGSTSIASSSNLISMLIVMGYALSQSGSSEERSHPAPRAAKMAIAS